MADNELPRKADFVGRVVSDANHPPETRMLTGWLGDAGEEGYTRLYTDAELSNYADIPVDAILYTEPIRDVQPAGGVFVWVKRDAALKQGGSAAARASRFLQGQVQQDYASLANTPEKAGLRCATEVPCGEPTGFTGQCTNQPEIGGAWPCLTAAPVCYEVTGFTGQCTHQPWPNPTRYIGCTILHCPTHDLTHIPHICNIVASGLPGCGGVELPRGGTDEKAAAAGGAAAQLPETQLPGCGYTKNWGLCETQLLGCGFTKQWGHQCPTLMPGCGQTNDCPTTMPGCGLSRNPICTDLPGCGWTKQWGLCNPTQPPKCQVSVANPCMTQTEMPTRCGPCGDDLARRAFGAGMQFGPAGLRAVVPGAIPNTQFDGCNTIVVAVCPSAVDACPSKLCFTEPPTALCTQVPQGNCPTIPELCPTKAPAFCPPTTIPDLCPCTTPPEKCPTGCGVDCQTPQPICTQCNCTQAGPQCPPPPTIGIICPTMPVVCPDTVQCPPTQFGPQCPQTVVPPCGDTNAQLDCTFFVCPTGPQQCPSVQQVCPNTIVAICQTIDARGLRAAPAAQPLTSGPALCTQLGPQCPTQAAQCTFFGPGCPPTPATVCTQSAPGCPTYPNGDCTFFGGCMTVAQIGAAGPVTVCTQSGPQCPTQRPACTCFGPACPPTPGIICTQSGPQCPTHQWPCTQQGPQCPPTPATVCTQLGCPSPGFECTMFCTQTSPQCAQQAAQPAAIAAGRALGGVHPTLLTLPVWHCNAPTPATRCFICPPHSPLPWQCPPSPWCPPMTQTFLCGGGGPSAVDACPTRICG